MFHTRTAQPADAAYLHELSARVQDALTRSGSLQAFGPIPMPTVEAMVQQGYAHLALVDGERVGGVFLQPLPPELAAEWGIPSDGQWFLSKLMIDPARRGSGYGAALVRVLQTQQRPIVLDCWAGNVKLRQLYEGLDFGLWGVFAEGDYQIAVYRWSPTGVVFR
jgi:GNAT superfamily N-acetyltransferase